MDYSLIGADEQNERYLRASYSSKDEHGNTYINKDLDVSLLMMYGYILYMGSGYAYSLRKFLPLLAFLMYF
jgi:general transcription factor 3C polypeptide 3 (transcription factor C subunit 4)